jgi:hypothetical protein
VIITALRKKCHERIYTPEEWYEVIKSARKRNPFTVTPVSQEMVVDYGKLAPFFKKSVRSGKQPLSMQKGRVFEYANAHASEVWVMNGGENEQWSKFAIGKTEPKNTHYFR